jgi:Ribbon-helix-helix protein, copG family
MRAPGEPSNPRRLPAGLTQTKSGQRGHPQADRRVHSCPTLTITPRPNGPTAHGASMTTTLWYRKQYRDDMAMNLRLPEELADALRTLSEQTGRSQQDLAREALAEFVRNYPLRAYPREVRHLITPAAGPDTGAPSWKGIDGAALLEQLLADRRASR